MLLKFLTALLNALLGQFRQGLDDRRDDQAHRDAGQATEAAQNAREGLEVSEAMARAEAAHASPDATETALEQGAFLMSRNQPRRRRK